MRITESRLRRIVRDEARRLAESHDDMDFGGSKYGLYGDRVDQEIDGILAEVRDAVLDGQRRLDAVLAGAEDLGSRDAEAHWAVWDAFSAACRVRRG